MLAIVPGMLAIVPGQESSHVPIEAPRVLFNFFLTLPQVSPTAATPIFAYQYALIGFETTSPTLNGNILDLAQKHQTSCELVYARR